MDSSTLKISKLDSDDSFQDTSKMAITDPLSSSQKSTEIHSGQSSCKSSSFNEMDSCKQQAAYSCGESIRNQIVTNLKRQLVIYQTNESLTDPLRNELIEENRRLVIVLSSLSRVSKTTDENLVEDIESSGNSSFINQSIVDIKEHLRKLTHSIEASLIEQKNELFQNALIQPVDPIAKHLSTEQQNSMYVQALVENGSQLQSHDMSKPKEIKTEFKVENSDTFQEVNASKEQNTSEKNGNEQSDQIKDSSAKDSNGKSIESKPHWKLGSASFGRCFTIELSLKNVKSFFEQENCDYCPTFRIAKINWFIAFYSKVPKLSRLNLRRRRLGIYLQCDDQVEKTISVKADLILLNQTYGHKNKVRSFEYSFSRRHGYGWPAFISFEKLIQKGFVKNDRLIFQFFLWIN